jgi:hypothetical protein
MTISLWVFLCLCVCVCVLREIKFIIKVIPVQIKRKFIWNLKIMFMKIFIVVFFYFYFSFLCFNAWWKCEPIFPFCLTKQVVKVIPENLFFWCFFFFFLSALDQNKKINVGFTWMENNVIISLLKMCVGSHHRVFF